MQSSRQTYHIIGGGISGLACAYQIKKRRPEIRTIIYEAASKLGGRAYSYNSASLGGRIDNAVHMIVGANKNMSQFVKNDEWHTLRCFISPKQETIDTSLVKNYDLMFKNFCNTSHSIAKPIKQQIIRSFFPFLKPKTKFWFSQSNLSQRIINILATGADEICLNSRLQKIQSQFGVAAALDFGTHQVDIGSHDKVIIALDNISCSKILKVQPLEHNQIVNIIYRTSETIFLPKGVSLVNLRSSVVDSIYVGDKLLVATISDFKGDKTTLSHIAYQTWSELDKIRGVNSAFMPPFKAVCYPNATLCQTAEVNNKRPNDATSEYPNVFIAGDWTLKNHPCCMETAFLSAIRAIKTALKSN